MTDDLESVHKSWMSSPGKANFFVAATPHEGDVAVACMAYRQALNLQQYSFHIHVQG